MLLRNVTFFIFQEVLIMCISNFKLKINCVEAFKVEVMQKQHCEIFSFLMGYLKIQPFHKSLSSHSLSSSISSHFNSLSSIAYFTWCPHLVLAWKLCFQFHILVLFGTVWSLTFSMCQIPTQLIVYHIKYVGKIKRLWEDGDLWKGCIFR